VYFTFICYLSIGLPIAVLPPFVHLRMGRSAALAGLVVSIQYVATVFSRPWAGRISDELGAKVSVLWGMASCAAAGVLVWLAASLSGIHLLSFVLLVLSRFALGIGESLGSTGATLWGITAAGPEHTAKVIGMNGISTYGAMALAAPLGVLLDAWLGLGAIGALTLLLCAASFSLAWRKEAIPAAHGEHLPFRRVAGRVAPHGMGLALGGVGYSVLATFVTLFFAHQHWNGAALCLTAFGVSFVAVRVLFIRAIGRYGGYKVAITSLVVESVGVALLWLSVAPWMALVGAAVSGLGFSLVFPAVGVEAVKRVPEFNRGTALGVYTAFADVSFFVVGPLAGAIAGSFGYGQVFLLALVSVLVALGIVVALQGIQKD
jgi:MFS family permease